MDSPVAAPAWFQRALDMQPTSHQVTADGCRIHYLRWGPDVSEQRGLLFLHAGGAHAHWWSFIAPFLASNRPVVAMDFSGMGDSGRRDHYSSAHNVAEIAAVLADARLGLKPIVIGHSFGGFIAMCFGHRYSADLSGMVFVDTALRPAAESEADPVKPYTGKPRFSPDPGSLLARFRLGPAQPRENGFILEHIAKHSIAEHPEGWTWKFDPAARGADHHAEPLVEYVTGLDCRKALIYGAESSMVTPEVAPFLTSLFKPGEPTICVPEAHHHLHLDQPLAFVAALRSILSVWQT
jgi:pimeloyl-ACP methyl ester carboxylesterase